MPFSWLSFSHEAKNDAVRHLAFDAQETRLLTGNNNGGARVWEIASGNALTGPLQHPDNPGLRGLFGEFTPDGALVVTAGSYDLTARVWETSSGHELHQGLSHPSQVEHLAIAPGGRRPATADARGFAWVWDLITGQLLAQPHAHPGRIIHLQWSWLAK